MAKARSAQMGQQDQRQQEAEQRRQEAEQRVEQRRAVCRSVLEPEALERLNRIGLVKPEKQVRLEELIFANVSRGTIKQKIDQGTFVNLLQQIERSEDTSKISFKRTAFDDDSDLDLDHLE